MTRYYRAPEVLLSGGRYTSAIDVWSVGCVLGELLLRRPLFPGENYLHQLQLITETLGSPSEEDMAFVRAPAARNFMLRLPRSPGVPLSALFPHVRGPVLDLLGRMLTFDPAKRATVEECLAHPFLARVRAARRGINEDAAPPHHHPGKFRLRVPGGATGLRNMPVEALKARFYAELCGQPLTPTPSGTPQQAPLFPASFPSPSLTTSAHLPPTTEGAASAAGVTTVVGDATSGTGATAAAAAAPAAGASPEPAASTSGARHSAYAPLRDAGAGSEERWAEEDFGGDSDNEEEDEGEGEDDAENRAFYEREAANRQATHRAAQASAAAPERPRFCALPMDAASPIPGVPISMQGRVSSGAAGGGVAPSVAQMQMQQRAAALRLQPNQQSSNPLSSQPAAGAPPGVPAPIAARHPSTPGAMRPGAITRASGSGGMHAPMAPRADVSGGSKNDPDDAEPASGGSGATAAAAAGTSSIAAKAHEFLQQYKPHSGGAAAAVGTGPPVTRAATITAGHTAAAATTTTSSRSSMPTAVLHHGILPAAGAPSRLPAAAPSAGGGLSRTWAPGSAAPVPAAPVLPPPGPHAGSVAVNAGGSLAKLHGAFAGLPPAQRRMSAPAGAVPAVSGPTSTGGHSGAGTTGAPKAPLPGHVPHSYSAKS